MTAAPPNHWCTICTRYRRMVTRYRSSTKRSTKSERRVRLGCENTHVILQGICHPQALVGEACPATQVTGSLCRVGDEISYCGSEEGVSCGSTH